MSQLQNIVIIVDSKDSSVVCIARHPATLDQVIGTLQECKSTCHCSSYNLTIPTARSIDQSRESKWIMGALLPPAYEYLETFSPPYRILEEHIYKHRQSGKVNWCIESDRSCPTGRACPKKAARCSLPTKLVF
jgi:hypothetical protein